MKKQYSTLAKTASKVILTLILLTSGKVYGFTVISYDGNPARWEPGKSIDIDIDTDFAPHFDSSGCDNAGPCIPVYDMVLNAIQAWENVSGTNLNFNQVRPKTISKNPSFDGKNEIKMIASGWNDLPFSPPSSALAVTISTYKNPNFIVDSDIFINGDHFQWAHINDESEHGQYDLQSVLTHEMGHFIGLDHTSTNPNENEQAYFDATMFFASRPGETLRRNLGEQDILGTRHLYASQNFPTPAIDDITPEIAVVDSQNITLEIFGQDFYPTASVIVVRNTSQGDLQARVVSVESDRLVVKIPADSLKTGTYDVVVGNSYDSYIRIDQGLNVQNNYLYGTYDQDLKTQSSSRAGCQSSQSGSLLWMFLPLLALATTRRIQTPSDPQGSEA